MLLLSKRNSRLNEDALWGEEENNRCSKRVAASWMRK